MDPAEIEVEVVYCARPGQIDRTPLRLPAGATLAAALDASGVCARHGLDVAGVSCGVWSKVQPLQAALRGGDRVEVYRPLNVDPKEARRLRYKRKRAG